MNTPLGIYVQSASQLLPRFTFQLTSWQNVLDHQICFLHQTQMAEDFSSPSAETQLKHVLLLELHTETIRVQQVPGD